MLSILSQEMFMKHTILLGAVILLGSTAQASDGSSQSFDYSSVSRLAVLWDSQALWYGVLPEVVTNGEELADYLTARVPKKAAAVNVNPLAPIFTILPGNYKGVEEVAVGRDWISNEYGISSLTAEEVSRIEHFVLALPLDNRVSERSGTSSLVEYSYSYVAEAGKEDVLINADIWDAEPKMLSAGLGFTDILGVAGLDVDQPQQSEELVRAAGGTWNTVDCSASGGTPRLGAFTSAQTPAGIAIAYGSPVILGDGLPVVFSWPIRPSTLDATDFVVILNDGARVTPEASSLVPNFDFNERAVSVLVGQFGNRFAPDDPRARFPSRVEVVADSTPLQLIGPGGKIVSAVGLGVESGTAYTDPDVPPAERGGPRLVGAKLNHMSAEGDGNPPNDGITLYGDQAQYRLRVYTSGGFSPDGVRGMFPTEYSRYFRIHATTNSGETVLLTETGVDYDIDGTTAHVVGLAELGPPADVYDDCYAEDQDNQIDIILAGDEAAMRRITAVEVPSVSPYSPLFNPGGPGNQPTPGVRYSAPSPPHLVPVLQALDDPMTVTFME
jgi:hypothetical protein